MLIRTVALASLVALSAVSCRLSTAPAPEKPRQDATVAQLALETEDAALSELSGTVRGQELRFDAVITGATMADLGSAWAFDVYIDSTPDWSFDRVILGGWPAWPGRADRPPVSPYLLPNSSWGERIGEGKLKIHDGRFSLSVPLRLLADGNLQPVIAYHMELWSLGACPSNRRTVDFCHHVATYTGTVTLGRDRGRDRLIAAD